jgi:acetyl-CoA carboxylase biotin carboxyl carrier protein
MTSGIQFDPEAIRALAQILKDTDLSEIELVEKDSRIRVARALPAAPGPVTHIAWPAGMVPAGMPGAAGAFPVEATAGGGGGAPVAMLSSGGAATAYAASTVSSAAEGVDPKHPGLIASPMVGVVYLAPEPGAAPFVTVGSRVAQGQTLLLIEAMKTFNQVRAPRAGTVSRILVEAGMPVEYGEPLMIVE